MWSGSVPCISYIASLFLLRAFLQTSHKAWSVTSTCTQHATFLSHFSSREREKGSTVFVDLFILVVFSLSLKLLPQSDTPQLYFFSTPQPTAKAPCILWPFCLLQLKQWICLVCFVLGKDWAVTPPIQHCCFFSLSDDPCFVTAYINVRQIFRSSHG